MGLLGTHILKKEKMNCLRRPSWGFCGPTFQKKETESSDNWKQNRNKTIFGLIDSDIFSFFRECGSAKASRRPFEGSALFPSLENVGPERPTKTSIGSRFITLNYSITYQLTLMIFWNLKDFKVFEAFLEAR